VKLLEGRKGLVFGIANDRSIACHIAKGFVGEGALCGFPYLPGEKSERRVQKALEEIGVTNGWLLPCDVSKDADLDSTFAATCERFDTIDFMVHSLAFADRTYLKPGKFAETPREVFAQALDISAYSLVAMARRAKALMPRGGSILAMTYYGSEKAIPGYNVMGVAKAALESSTRYLAYDLGPDKIRVNAISAGPIRTLAAAGVGGFRDMYKQFAEVSPLRENITIEDVGNAAVFLASDMASRITGEVLYVDSGFNAVGVQMGADKDGEGQ